jgi:hypothetical protein
MSDRTERMSGAGEAEALIERYLDGVARLLPGPAAARTDLLDELRDGLYSGAEAYRRAGYPPAEAASRSVAEFGAAAPIAAAHTGEVLLRLLRRAGYGLLGLLATMFAVGVAVTPTGPPVPGGHGSAGHIVLVAGGIVAGGAVLALLRLASSPRSVPRRVPVALAAAAGLALVVVSVEIGGYAVLAPAALYWPWAFGLPLASAAGLLGVAAVGRTVLRFLLADR